jgi:chitinase
LCEIIRPKKCSKDSGMTMGQTVGYFLASNSRDCVCDRVYPKDINANDYTYLYFVFASIDLKTFKIRP